MLRVRRRGFRKHRVLNGSVRLDGQTLLILPEHGFQCRKCGGKIGCHRVLLNVFALGATICQASVICIANSSSSIASSSTPTQPFTPTYGGLKYVFGDVLISIAWRPGAAGIQIATWPSLWWLFTNIAKTLLPRAKKVGAPCESFSIVSGIAKQIRRTRRRCSSPGSTLGFFAIRFN